MRSFRKYKLKWYLGGGALIVLICFVFCLPRPLFSDPYCTIIEDESGEFLNAQIASDGQWRFPPITKVPEKYDKAVVEFEDRNFRKHVGISTRGIARALLQNYRSKRIVSGASTLDMQVIRMSRKRQGRRWIDKVKESIMAFRLNFSYGKDEILKIHASHAPFGGNVVGLGAACWRYFGHGPDELSWSEAATLAVLPNAPSLIHPGKNRKYLFDKKNRLLTRLYDKGEISSDDFEAALLEPIPERPKPLPQIAPHFMQYQIQQGRHSEVHRTSLNSDLQKKMNRLAEIHSERLLKRGIDNLAFVVIDNKSGEIKAYIGNARGNEIAEKDVDLVRANRSTGSILKPFLFAMAIEDGMIQRKSLLPDHPMRFAGYSPENYDRSYDGMVGADEALYRSLNIPAVSLLRDYGVGLFKERLKDLGMSTLFRSADEYGLSLILGGAEAKLIDLAYMYRKLGLAVLNPDGKEAKLIDPGAAYQVLQILTKVNRPSLESNWQFFEGGRKVAWKTGTSFGARDAWAIGLTPEYTVAVWTGKADGEGCAHMTGTNAAGPLLFDIYDQLRKTSWFESPFQHLEKARFCRESGFIASQHCPSKYWDYLPLISKHTRNCSFHQPILMSSKGNYRVYKNCYQGETSQRIAFILPGIAEPFYRKKNPSYVQLPPFSPKCRTDKTSLEVIYPQEKSKLILPKLGPDEYGEVVFEVANPIKGSPVYWYLDNEYIGTTTSIHQLAIVPSAGNHRLTVTDAHANKLIRNFSVILGGNNTT